MITRRELGLVFDRNSFVETSEGFAPSVITGYGTVDGRLVYCYAQDRETNGGVFSGDAGKKITNILRLAVKSKAPVIGLLDSAGFLIDEGAKALDAFSQVYKASLEAGDEILQIMIVGGQCLGQMVSLSDMADFVFRDGDIEKSLLKTREILRSMPHSKGVLPPAFESTDDLNREVPEIRDLRGSGAEILRAISDDGFLLQNEDGGAPELTTGFIRMNGVLAAAMASERSVDSGRLGLKALIKAKKLVETADKFGLALVKVCDTDGLKDEDPDLMARAEMELVSALIRARVPKIDLITGEVTGGIAAIMNGKGTGSDLTFMWKDARVNIMSPEEAAEIVYGPLEAGEIGEKASEYVRTHAASEALIGYGICDRVIEPEESRKYLIGALETYANVF